MAVTTDGARLTEAHRQAQVGVRASTARDLLSLWPAFNIDDIAGSWPAIEAGLVPVVQRGHAASSELSARYYERFRTVEGVDGPWDPLRAPTPDRDDIVPNLRAAGPRKAGYGVAAGRSDVAGAVLTSIEGELAYQVLSGGRDTLVENVMEDRTALGWQRVTDGDPCPFCAMLASRGVIQKQLYRSERSAAFEAHPHCGCTAEPVWSMETQPVGRAEEFQQMWNDAQREAAASDKGLNRGTDNDALNAFRRYLRANPT